MTVPDILQRPVADAEQLLKTLAPLSTHPAARGLSTGLNAALRRIHDGRTTEDRPPVICLLGGTGVGKSSLFNKLIGVPGASPESTTRLATKKPFVAVSDKHRVWAKGYFGGAHDDAKNSADDATDSAERQEHSPTLVPIPEDQQCDWCLVDTPDIDGLLTSHHDITDAVLAVSDVVIFVTDRQRYNSFATHKHFGDWVKRKTWLFVMNKADEVDAGEADKLLGDWRCSLSRHGIAASAENTFFLSARDPNRYDFPRLLAALQTITPQHASPVRLVNAVGELSHALDAGTLRRLRELEATLRRECERLSQEFGKALMVAIRTPRIRAMLQTTLRERTWQAVASHTVGPVWLAVWLQARLTGVRAIYSIGSYFLRGTGLLGLAAISGASLVEGFRRQMALLQIVAVMRRDRSLPWSNLETSMTMILEDNHLENWRPAATQTEEDSPAQVPGIVGQVIRFLEGTFQKWLSRAGLTTNDPALANALDLTIEGLASGRAVRVTFWPWQLLANLLPTIALGSIFWRLGAAWYNEQYLPWAFYGMALGLFAMSCIPGIVVFWGLVALQPRTDMAAAFAELDASPMFAPTLEEAAEALRDSLRQVDRLREAIEATRRELQLTSAGLLAIAALSPVNQEAA